MALIERSSSCNGASVVFMMNDVTERVVSASVVTLGRPMQVTLFDGLGGSRSFVIPANQTRSVSLTTGRVISIRRIEIVRADGSVKAFLGFGFLVNF
jgi:hypothetical protein